jgi:hypothetical protein
MKTSTESRPESVAQATCLCRRATKPAEWHAATVAEDISIFTARPFPSGRQVADRNRLVACSPQRQRGSHDISGLGPFTSQVFCRSGPPTAPVRTGVNATSRRAIIPTAFLRHSWRSLSLLAAVLLVSFTVRGADVSGSDAIECANLIYAGTKSSVCFSEEFLSAVASESGISTARKFKAVKLAEKELFRFPFAVMTGEGAFTLTGDERKNLKAYLEKGGFLLASAGCSSKEWSDSFRREVEAIFPQRKLEDVPLTHPIFRTVYDVPRLDTKHEDARLFGLTLGGKTVLIYSPDGLNDTGTMHGCCCCGGNEIRNAQKLNANILAYALLQ